MSKIIFNNNTTLLDWCVVLGNINLCFKCIDFYIPMSDMFWISLSLLSLTEAKLTCSPVHWATVWQHCLSVYVYVLLKCGQLAGLALFKEKYVAVYVLWLMFLGHSVLIFPPNCGKMRKGVGQESIPLSLTVFFHTLALFLSVWMKNRSQIRPRTKCAHIIPVWCSFCGSVRSMFSILASCFCINAGIDLGTVSATLYCVSQTTGVHSCRTNCYDSYGGVFCGSLEFVKCLDSLINWIFHHH